MNKFLTLLATLLIIPALAFADSDCLQRTDQEWRDLFTSQAWVLPVGDDELGDLPGTGAITVTFDKNGTFKERVEMQSFLGNYILNAIGNWSINNAELNIHLVKATHTNSHNKKLNKILDEEIKIGMANPDVSIPLSIFCYDNSVRSVVSFSPFMKK